MTPAFVAAVVDTLLPGGSGGSAGEPPLPPGSVAGTNFSIIMKAHSGVFEAIANEAGSPDAFAAAAEPVRIAAVQAVERAMPEAFRALVSALLADYYESAPVLIAMGWRREPPQPRGHEMRKENDAIAERLDRVRSRGKKWRG